MSSNQNSYKQKLGRLENWTEERIAQIVPRRFYPRLRWLKHYLGDKFEGIDTSGDVECDELKLDKKTSSPYHPGGWFDLKTTLGDKVSKDDVFIDFGSGKGRIVYLAARDYEFKRVIGVEISERLNQIARKNIQKKMRNLRSKNIDLITSNVTEYSIPDDITIVYLYNPFTGIVFENLVGKIRDSLNRRNRTLRIIYRNPIMHNLLTSNGFYVELEMEDLKLYTTNTKVTNP